MRNKDNLHNIKQLTVILPPAVTHNFLYVIRCIQHNLKNGTPKKFFPPKDFQEIIVFSIKGLYYYYMPGNYYSSNKQPLKQYSSNKHYRGFFHGQNFHFMPRLMDYEVFGYATTLGRVHVLVLKKRVGVYVY